MLNTMDPRFIGRVPGYVPPPKQGRKTGYVPGPVNLGIGKKIRAGIRDKYGSQDKAAKAWGVSRQRVSMVVLEQSLPSEKMLKDLGLTAYWLPGRCAARLTRDGGQRCRMRAEAGSNVCAVHRKQQDEQWRAETASRLRRARALRRG